MLVVIDMLWSMLIAYVVGAGSLSMGCDKQVAFLTGFVAVVCYQLICLADVVRRK